MKKLTTLAFLLGLCIPALRAQAPVHGDLYSVQIEYVTPEHQLEYNEWGKAFKKLADDTHGVNFFVFQDNNSYSYVTNIGQKPTALNDHKTAWDNWGKANPAAEELFKKYHHTQSHSSRELWWIDLNHSYMPDKYSPAENPAYLRRTIVYLKVGEEAAATKLIEQYVAEYKKHQISVPFTIYWNIFGHETPCFGVTQFFQSREEWVKVEKEIQEKIGKEQLMKWQGEWFKMSRKIEDYENWIRNDLSHNNE
ncbi:MAG: hypothetical protein R3C61_27410 [Bacteroidia bacterium]